MTAAACIRIPAMVLSTLVCLAPAPFVAPRSAAGRLPALDGAIARVDSAALVVQDMDRSVDFFSNVLAFDKVSDIVVGGSSYERLYGLSEVSLRIVRMRLGDEALELLDFIAPEGRPVPADSRSNDLWFQHVAIIVRDMDRAYARLRAHNVRHASSGPQRLPDWNPNAGGIEAFYFKDPDGHVLEILEFPEGKGRAKWHVPGDRLFLGIDHTAIVVEDTERSLRFYRDGLGLGVVGESENYGIEQERLNDVSGARLRITALRAGSGPGIEFLDYLAPAGGRPSPADVRASDLIAWQTRVVSGDPNLTLSRLIRGTFALVSPGVVALNERQAGLSKGVLVRDPDGHALMIGAGS